MNAKLTMLRAAQLLEHDAECLKLSHTLNDEWRIDCPEDESAHREYGERLKIAAALKIYASVSA